MISGCDANRELLPSGETLFEALIKTLIQLPILSLIKIIILTGNKRMFQKREIFSVLHHKRIYKMFLLLSSSLSVIPKRKKINFLNFDYDLELCNLLFSSYKPFHIPRNYFSPIGHSNGMTLLT